MGRRKGEGRGRGGKQTRQIPGVLAKAANGVLGALEQVAPVGMEGGEVGFVEDLVCGIREARGVREGMLEGVIGGGGYEGGRGGGKGSYRECPADPERVAGIGYFVAAAVEAGPEEGGGWDCEGCGRWLWL